MNTLFRAIPSVAKILENISLYFKENNINSILLDYPQNLLVDFINNYMDKVRLQIKKEELKTTAEISSLFNTKHLIRNFEKELSPKLQSVINATGVVIHTNLGRSPLSDTSLEAIMQTATNYSTVEFDLSNGERGSRHSLVRDLLTKITNAEDALVVNNNAAAVMLVLSTFAQGGETIISRGELVEVGGSFRIPDVMECSGSKLREIGTTNKTHKEDYLKAINEETKAIMRVHTSNFRLIGFTSSVETAELSALAQENNLVFIEDLGSGSFVDFAPFGLPKEPLVQELVSQGVDVITFSGDKLLGGPQAGIIVGKKKYIEQIKKNQLLRALRPCKLTFAALEASLREYLNPQKALENIPTLRMLTMDFSEIEKNAKKLLSTLKKQLSKDDFNFSLKKDSSRVGGGAFPEAELPTVLVQIKPRVFSANSLKTRLLKTKPALIGRLEEECFSLDVRTLKISQFNEIAKIIASVI